jgi:hypothetical protein
MNPLIIDNFLPDPYVQSLYTLLTDQGTELDWHFSKFSVDYDAFEGDKYFKVSEPIKDHVRCTHSFIRENGIVDQKFYKYVLPLVAQFENMMSVKVSGTKRIRANMLFNLEGVKLQPPHVDGMNVIDGVYDCVGKKSMIYYVNNSDGDTVFYNERFTGEPLGYVTEQLRVTPKKGRAVIFDSNQVHAVNIPTEKAYRVVINCVFGV